MAAPHGPMLERALLLREFAAGLGARVLMISDTRCGLPAGAPELVVPVVDGDALGAIAFIAPLQLLAVELAACLPRILPRGPGVRRVPRATGEQVSHPMTGAVRAPEWTSP